MYMKDAYIATCIHALCIIHCNHIYCSVWLLEISTYASMNVLKGQCPAYEAFQV